MDAKIKGLIKDTLVLAVITLVSGFLLAFTYQITKKPIEQQMNDKKMNAYKEVFFDAESFYNNDYAKKMFDLTTTFTNSGKYGKVGIDEILAAKKSGEFVGYVVTAYSDDGYGGKIKISLGYDTKNKKITKIKVLEASETAGLGAKIAEDSFSGQFMGFSAKEATLVKSNKSADNEIQAISGATISSTAVTNIVNMVLAVLGGN